MNLRTPILVLLLSGTMLLGACEQEQQVVEIPLRPVKSITVTAASADRSRSFSGTSQSSEEARLSFKVSGNIRNIAVQVGDQVQSGAIIAELDPESYELQAQQSRANLASSQASLRNADANYQRVRSLYENNNASRNELDSARASAESLRAQVSANRKALEIANLNASYTRLSASNTCSIASVSVEVNENVSAGQEIVRADCGDTVEVGVAVPESLIQGITRGTAAQIDFSAIPRQSFNGTVTEVGVAATGGGNTFPVTIRIDDAHPQLRSGLAAEVTIQGAQPDSPDQAVIIVPEQAVVEDSEGRHVFIVEPSDRDGVGIIRRRAVEVGELTSGGLQIHSGLENGDELVTAGLTVVLDGMEVKI